jgi:serine/threonine-protein kinase
LDEASKRPSHPTLPTVYEKGRRGGKAAPPPGPELEAGAVLGQYRVVAALGAGGMGSVYEAVHTEIGKTVALKVLSRELAEDPRAQQRFLREALLASRLEHPNVVKVTDFGSTGGVPFLVMELLRGEDLADAINRSARGLPFEEATDVLLAVAAGVYAAHQAGVVHRDLKPRNIFLARNQLGDVDPKVLDFGISRQDGLSVGTVLTASGALLGTVPYLSPEHVKGGTPDARSDQYALGVMLYECVTGRQPHEGHTPYALMQNIAEGRFFPPSVLNLAVPPPLEREILRAMSTDPAARFPSVYAFGQALLPFASKRQRVRWSEYFGRATSMVPRAPEAEPAPATRTTMLPELPSELLPLPKASGDAGPRARMAAEATATNESITPVRSAPGRATRAARGATPDPITRSGPQPREEVTAVRRRGFGGVLAFAALAVAAMWMAPRVWHRYGATVRELARGAPNTLAPPAVERAGTTSPAPEGVAPAVPPSAAVTPPPAAVAATPAAAPAPAPPPMPTAAAAPVTPEPSVAPAAKVDQAANEAPRADEARPARNITVDVVSRPAGAMVWLAGDRQSRGRTPLTLTIAVSSKPVRLSLQLAGHRARTIGFVPERSGQIDLVLTPVRAAHATRGTRQRSRSVAPDDAPATDDLPATAEPQPAPPPPSTEDRYEKLLD